MDQNIEYANVLKEFGFAAIAFILVYVMLKQEQKRAHMQYDKLVEFSSTIVTMNTKALTHMNDGMKNHMDQKEKFVEQMKDCANGRDERFRRIEKKIEDVKNEVDIINQKMLG